MDNIPFHSVLHWKKMKVEFFHVPHTEEVKSSFSGV